MVRDFEVHVKLLWEWAFDLAGDPLLSPHFVWDVEKVSKFNGTRYVCIYHEPWIADSFWNAQVCEMAL